MFENRKETNRKDSRRISRADICLMAFFLLLALGCFGWSVLSRKEGQRLQISYDGQTVMNVPLSQIRPQKIAGEGDGAVRYCLIRCLDESVSCEWYDARPDLASTVPDGGSYNLLAVSVTGVFMEAADCRDQICVHHIPLTGIGESMICLPHKLVVEMAGEADEGTLDGIAKAEKAGKRPDVMSKAEKTGKTMGGGAAMRRTAELGFLLALALILSYVESLIPFSFGVPGIKLGLPNLIVLLLLYGRNEEQTADGESASRTGFVNFLTKGEQESLLVNALRIVLSGFLFSNLYAILYALAGAAFSFLAMIIGRRSKRFSVVGVSVLGGVFHNVGQLLVAMAVVETLAVAYYVPFLIVAGTVTGALLGVAGMEILPYLRRLMQEEEWNQ